MKPLIIINFKTYPEAAGKKALPLAQKISQVKKNNYEIIIAPSLLTLMEVAEKTNLTVFSQHADYTSLGAHTGRISIEEMKLLGITGTILNHSERKIPLHFLKEIVDLCKSNHLKTVVCASNLAEVKKVAEFHPEYIAYEPEELIGGNISVTKAKPDIIVQAVEAVEAISPKTKVLCGAGVHSREDFGQALLLGAKGVLIGHSVVKAKDPRKFLTEMLM